MQALFGPAGNSESFHEKGYKNNVDIPVYLKEFGLTAYEYQCGRGVKISEKSAQLLGKAALDGGVSLSLHAPYYISLSSVEEEKRDNSINYVLQSAVAANAMGAKRIIVHSGSCGKLTRSDALALAKDTLARCVTALKEKGLEDIIICPETMGKINQLGNLEEVMELCKVDERFVPCIDFGHLNARTFGGVKTKQDFEDILLTIENQLGSDRLKIFHSHFSKIEYTTKGGEKKHLTFEDTVFGPNFDDLAELVAKKSLTPTFICESAGTQAEDAATMMKIYQNALHSN
ncbi:MAG: putative deoxyribonuclease [Oscillospiraceae bacterium]|jgi:deoxyribonuclease-4|nr:putative deoxyribonuclease [Oscillospiraceae bacterium]